MASSPREGGLQQPRSQAPPFTTRFLDVGNDQSDQNNQNDPNAPLGDGELMLLLPAVYRVNVDDLAAPSYPPGGRRNPAIDCIKADLDLQRLERVSDWLWVAGRLLPPRPLHYQLLLSRDVFVTEQMDMHLVWTTGRIFIKPMPRYLLEPRFWKEHLCCSQQCPCSMDEAQSRENTPECERPKLLKCALGFLFSYAALIRHESDFLLAKEKYLLPEEVKWPDWISFVKELNMEHIYPHIHPRFYHAELRLSRLNKLYQLSQTPFRGYMAHWNQYTSFFRDHFALLAGTTVYIAVVLTAMQVGLATTPLASNGPFQSASYGFAVFSIIGPLICVGLIVLRFCVIFIQNLRMTVVRKRQRLNYMLPV